ncbi:MAG: aminotransferase class V-fold PLP-dependent enzyme [Flavobacteriaceae bacterium]|nr:aminotransferase class V-fold PLP-dependent enzyme [Flavobacteriaceae bacterium]
MKDLKAQFPVTQDHTYLNTASCGLLSESLVNWRAEHDRKLMRGGSLFRDLHKAHISEIRSGVANFFSTTEDTVALVPNFSFGLNSLLDGLPSSDKVLLLKGDYPSVNWAVEHRDFHVCYADIDENLEDNIVRIIEAEHPDIFAFSVVQYISGLKIDLDFLKKLKTAYPNMLFLADGTQFLGTTQFNFNESSIDVIGASSYKWLLGGYGNGVFLINKDAQDRIHPRTIGFNSADAQFSKQNEIEFVGRLEPGHQDTLNYGSLWESIQFLNALGMEHIEAHLAQLSQKARAAFQDRGLLSKMAMQRTNHSTIFNLKGDRELLQKLNEAHIITSYRGKGIRASFHFYNTEEDLQKLLEVFDR